MKPHRRTKFLKTKIDTCSNVNLIPISVYKLVYRDKDCTKLEPSNKAAVKTYTTEKIKIVGSCKIFVVHPDTKLIQEVTFHITSHEGSVIVSCATSIELGLIHPHTNLDEVCEGSQIYSIADMPKKQRNKSCQAESNVCSKKPEMKSRNKKSVGTDKSCTNTICENIDSKSQVAKKSDKNKQADKNRVMQSVTTEENTDVQLPKPARLRGEKNCQSTRC